MRWLVICTALSLACAGVPLGAPIPADEESFGNDVPSEEELARYEDAAAWSEARDGRALLVMRGEDIVYERYRDDVDPEVSSQLNSGTKLFSCALAGIGVRDGWLDLDAPIADTLPGFTGSPDVTARHLLQFTSGLREDNWRLTLDSYRDTPRIADKVAIALTQPQDTPPGEVYNYASVHLWLFSALVAAHTGHSAEAELNEQLFAPIGLRTGGWMTDEAGNTSLAYGAFTTAREWAKFGILLRDDGMWEGERLLPEGWVDLCRTGSAANPAYGLATWLSLSPEGADLGRIDPPADGGPLFTEEPQPEWLVGAGAKNQRLYILPDEDLVIVLLSDGSSRFDDRDFLDRLLPPSALE